MGDTSVVASYSDQFSVLLLNAGDYFRADDSTDQSPGNLSSSSLRRKLFLDVNGSISDSLPSASPGSPPSSAGESLEVFYPIDLSLYSLGTLSRQHAP